MAETQNVTNSDHVAYTRWLAESGQEDVLSLRRETAERVLTEKRMEIVEELAEREPTSVRDLARRLDRDVSIVSRDLDVLFEAAVVEFEQDGRAKRPVLAHENVFVEPVLFNGNTMAE
jgi:predicted transcriptional regulator